MTHSEVCAARKSMLHEHDEPLDPLEPDDDNDGRQRLLDAAVRCLEASCEADLRMSAIAEEAGVTIALITHHFGSRDGLIAAAQRVRVTGAARGDIDFMSGALANPGSADQWREQFQEMLASVLDDQRAPIRLGRLAALAAAHGRETLKDELSQEITRLCSAIADLIERAQWRGFVRDDVDSRAAAAVVQALLFGFVLADLDNERATWNDIRSVVMVMFDNLRGTT